MSIFSRINKSRQQAKQHNAKVVELQKKEETKTPYKHVPTHAASDAIASAPPSWREADRARILEQHQRRSAMMASGHHMNMVGIPRVGSNLSQVSFPSDAHANPMVRVPRSYSYQSVSYSPHHSRDVLYSVASGTSLKGKSRDTSYDVSRTSPTSSNGEPSSSGESNSSQDDLEISSGRTTAPKPSAKETKRRLHASRRISDSAIDRIAMANSARAPRDARPPPTSMRSIAPMAPIINGTTRVSPNNAVMRPAMSSRQNSSASLSGQTLGAASPSVPASPALAQDAAYVQQLSPPQSRDPSPEAPTAVEVVPVVSTKPKDRKSVKLTKFTELERIESNSETAQTDSSYTLGGRSAIATAKEQVILNVFPEEVTVAQPEPTKNKHKRFSRSGGFMKGFWGGSKTAVAV